MKYRLFVLLMVFVSQVGGRAQNFDLDAPRELRYTPTERGFEIINGTKRYNRALYGSNTAFRVEAGDLPIFGLFMPEMGGNIQLGLLAEDRSDTLWLHKAQYIRATYMPALDAYEYCVVPETRDTLKLLVFALKTPDGETSQPEGMVMKLKNMPKGRRMVVQYGGASGKKFWRSGDLNADPEGCFDLKPGASATNKYVLDGNGFKVTFGAKRVIELNGAFVADKVNLKLAGESGDQVLHAEICGDGFEFCIVNPETVKDGVSFKKAYGTLLEYMSGQAKLLQFRTPCSYLNNLAAVVVNAADAIYEHPTYMHGAVAWRMRLNGWRGAYSAAALGQSDRAKAHFGAYAQSQLTMPKDGAVMPDSALNITRSKEKIGTAMFTEGYICRNPGGDVRPHHYDMNLVFIDQMLRYIVQYGDTAFAREMWPVIERHLAWEKRVFDADGDHLFDAYACIWASDALMYSGGKVTHSSAYNYFAFKQAARIADVLGLAEKSLEYAAEAEAIKSAIKEQLWLPEGYWAEYKEADLKPYFSNTSFEPRVHKNAALWTIYHAVDSEVDGLENNYKATQYVDRCMPHIPIRVNNCEALDKEGFYTLATTDWMPYNWSINNVAMAEVVHTALAYFEACRPEEAVKLLKGAVLSSMYLGSSPGNVGQIDHYDAARGETYRDFADPTGILARTVVEGLFGVRRNYLNGELELAPMFPREWKSAEFAQEDVKYSYAAGYVGDKVSLVYRIESCKGLKVKLRVPMWGRDEKCSCLDSRIESCKVTELPTHGVAEIEYKSSGEDVVFVEYTMDEPVDRESVSRADERFNAVTAASTVLPESVGKQSFVNLKSLFNTDVKDIFRQKYLAPRWPYTTLQLPAQGIGEWCHPKQTAVIEDSALRARHYLETVNGLRFDVEPNADGANAVFVSHFDNYPSMMEIPLDKKQMKGAKSICLLLAGTTNHMHSRMDNGEITVEYADGSVDTLHMQNPDNWAPIEQEYYVNNHSFSVTLPRPYRVMLHTGEVSQTFPQYTDGKKLDDRMLPGGAATILRFVLKKGAVAKRMVLRPLSPDVIIGLMGMTVEK